MRNEIIENRILVSNDSAQAYDYAKLIIKGRWPEAEPIIMGNPLLIYYYARDVIKGRWLEAEPFILKSSAGIAYNYARDIIKGRWLEAESLIIKHPNTAYFYALQVINQRWFDLEIKLFEKEYGSISNEYCKYFYSTYNQFLPLWLKYYTNENIIINYFE